jgi:hypothetical protein
MTGISKWIEDGSVSLAAHCTSAEFDRQERKGAKPSDHAPVIAVFHEPSRLTPSK